MLIKSFTKVRPDIDSQHQKLVDMINELHEAMTQGKANDKVGEILDRLINYCVTHFNHEEQIMKRDNIPNAQAHIREHEAFKAEMVEFQKKFKDGSAGVSVQVMNKLSSWLRNHISKIDANTF